MENPLLVQLLKNVTKLLKAYGRTKDESLIPIVESLLQLAIGAAEETHPEKIGSIEEIIKQARDIGIHSLQPDPVEPWPEPPTVVIYGVTQDMGPSAYAAPPIAEITSDKDLKVTVSSTTVTDCHEASHTGSLKFFDGDSSGDVLKD